MNICIYEIHIISVCRLLLFKGYEKHEAKTTIQTTKYLAILCPWQYLQVEETWCKHNTLPSQITIINCPFCCSLSLQEDLLLYSLIPTYTKILLHHMLQSSFHKIILGRNIHTISTDIWHSAQIWIWFEFNSQENFTYH